MLTTLKLIAFFLILSLPLFGGVKRKKVSTKRKQDIEVLSGYSVNEYGNLEWTEQERNHSV